MTLTNVQGGSATTHKKNLALGEIGEYILCEEFAGLVTVSAGSDSSSVHKYHIGMIEILEDGGTIDFEESPLVHCFGLSFSDNASIWFSEKNGEVVDIEGFSTFLGIDEKEFPWDLPEEYSRVAHDLRFNKFIPSGVTYELENSNPAIDVSTRIWFVGSFDDPTFYRVYENLYLALSPKGRLQGFAIALRPVDIDEYERLKSKLLLTSRGLWSKLFRQQRPRN